MKNILKVQPRKIINTELVLILGKDIIQIKEITNDPNAVFSHTATDLFPIFLDLLSTSIKEVKNEQNLCNERFSKLIKRIHEEIDQGIFDEREFKKL